MRKTIYAKMTALPVGLCALAFAVTSCGSSEYKKFADNEGKQVASILRENDCLACHSENAPLPFYGNLPLIGPVVQADMKEAVHYVDLTAMVEALENGQPVSEVDLAKVENTALSGSMPPAKYSHMPMHWGTSLDDNEKAVIISWAKNVRKDRFTTETVAEEFKNEPLQPLMNTGGVDRKQYSEGINGQFGGVNAPTVYNAALNFVQFWDGRAADLKEQAAGPPLNPVEMGCTSFDQICEALAQDKDFTKKFTEVYPEGYSQSTITDAIAEFEKTLLTPSRFDKYLMGDKNALTAEELEGYQLFKDNKCATCHVGVNVGGQSYEFMGIKNSYFDYRNTGLTDGDTGRYAVTKKESDRHKFKTPTLRNVMLTYPYMHDGTVASVEDAIRIMHEFQIGKEINDVEVEKIVVFLGTLNGEYNGKMLQ